MPQWQKQLLHEFIRDLQQGVLLAGTKEEIKQVKGQLEAASRQSWESPFPNSTQAS